MTERDSWERIVEEMYCGALNCDAKYLPQVERTVRAWAARISALIPSKAERACENCGHIEHFRCCECGHVQRALLQEREKDA